MIPGVKHVCPQHYIHRRNRNMGMTMTQKILAAAAGLEKVEAGQLIEAELDLVLGNDITSPVAIHEMDKMTVDTAVSYTHLDVYKRQIQISGRRKYGKKI